jgi:hypothetical protein
MHAFSKLNKIDLSEIKRLLTLAQWKILSHDLAMSSIQKITAERFHGLIKKYLPYINKYSMFAKKGESWLLTIHKDKKVSDENLIKLIAYLFKPVIIELKVEWIPPELTQNPSKTTQKSLVEKQQFLKKII